MSASVLGSEIAVSCESQLFLIILGPKEVSWSEIYSAKSCSLFLFPVLINNRADFMYFYGSVTFLTLVIFIKEVGNTYAFFFMDSDANV